MRQLNLLSCLVIVAGTLGTASLAEARYIPYQTPGELRSFCNTVGGSYGATGGRGVYTCQLTDGNTIACGGVGKYARTCSNPAPRTGSGTPSKGGPVVRDHRTGGNQPAPTNPGPIGPVGAQTSPSTKTPGTPRDHRTGPVVRAPQSGPVVRDHRTPAVSGTIGLRSNNSGFSSGGRSSGGRR